MSFSRELKEILDASPERKELDFDECQERWKTIIEHFVPQGFKKEMIREFDYFVNHIEELNVKIDELRETIDYENNHW
jgi:hypothetical protein